MGSCFSQKRISKEYYFNVEESGYSTISSSEKNNSSKQKLEFTINNCEEGHTYQIFSTLNDNISSPYKSEKVSPTSNSNSITFKACLIFDYFPDRKQMLYIDLLKDSNLLINVKTQMDNIVNSSGHFSNAKICEDISIKAFGQNIIDDKKIVEFDFEVENLNKINFSDPKNFICYSIEINKEKEKEKPIYRSESISFEGTFDKARIPSFLLQNGFTVKFLNAMQETINEKNGNTLVDFTDQKKKFYLRLENPEGKFYYIYNRSHLIQNKF